MMARGERGFTLAELLVASAIAAIVAMTAYAVLRAVVQGASAVEAASRERTTARSLLDGLRREVAGAVALRAPARPRDEAGEGVAEEEEGARASVALLTVDGAEGLPGEVAYTFEGETLVRWARPADAAEPAEPLPIPGVEALGMRFGRGGRWSDDWSDSAPPEAVAVRLRLDGEEYVTVFPVGAGG